MISEDITNDKQQIKRWMISTKVIIDLLNMGAEFHMSHYANVLLWLLIT